MIRLDAAVIMLAFAVSTCLVGSSLFWETVVVGWQKLERRVESDLTACVDRPPLVGSSSVVLTPQTDDTWCSLREATAKREMMDSCLAALREVQAGARVSCEANTCYITHEKAAAPTLCQSASGDVTGTLPRVGR